VGNWRHKCAIDALYSASAARASGNDASFHRMLTVVKKSERLLDDQWIRLDGLTMADLAAVTNERSLVGVRVLVQNEGSGDRSRNFRGVYWIVGINQSTLNSEAMSRPRDVNTLLSPSCSSLPNESVFDGFGQALPATIAELILHHYIVDNSGCSNGWYLGSRKEPSPIDNNAAHVLGGTSSADSSSPKISVS
jgi:hypothetical protein